VRRRPAEVETRARCHRERSCRQPEHHSLHPRSSVHPRRRDRARGIRRQRRPGAEGRGAQLSPGLVRRAPEFPTIASSSDG
jgi:hypothetical protein